MAGAFLIAAVGRLLDLADAAALKTFTIVSSSIVIEPLPFVMVGALVFGLIEVYVSDANLSSARQAPRRPFSCPRPRSEGSPFPVCECGSVPIRARGTNRRDSRK